MNNKKIINVKGIEEWREYVYECNVYKVEKPTVIHLGDTGHRVETEEGVTHWVPLKGLIAIRWKGGVVA